MSMNVYDGTEESSPSLTGLSLEGTKWLEKLTAADARMRRLCRQAGQITAAYFEGNPVNIVTITATEEFKDLLLNGGFQSAQAHDLAAEFSNELRATLHKGASAR